MSLGPNPVFRKAIVPWYESKRVCWGLLVFMTLVLLFGSAGVYVAAVNPVFLPHMWVPGLLIVMALVVIVSAIRQLLSFYID